MGTSDVAYLEGSPGWTLAARVAWMALDHYYG